MVAVQPVLQWTNQCLRSTGSDHFRKCDYFAVFPNSGNVILPSRNDRLYLELFLQVGSISSGGTSQIIPLPVDWTSIGIKR